LYLTQNVVGFIGFVWGVVMYIKATSVASELDTGKATLAVLLPFLALLILGALVLAMLVLWLIIIF
jgi:hypothetical protein